MNKEFILNVFNGYSLGELKARFPEHSIRFIERVFPNDIVSKGDMSNLLMSDSVLNFLLDKEKRREFISRMSKDSILHVIQKVYPEFSGGVTVETYSTLVKFANENIVVFLRALGFELTDSDINDEKSKKDIVSISPNYALYEYQEDLSNKVIEDINNTPSNKILLHLPTGAGKTRTAMNIVSQHLRTNKGSLVIWITASNELCEQASNEFLKAWSLLGSYKTSCYNYFGKHSLSLGGIKSGFLVAGIQQLYNRMTQENSLQFKDLSKNCTLLVFDEAHQCVAPTYKATVDQIINSSIDTYMLGLTATPGRGGFESTDEDIRLASYFKNRKITMHQAGYESPVQYLMDNEYLAKPIFHKLEYTIPFKDKDSINSLNEEDAIFQLSLVDDRNSAIIQKVEDEFKKEKSIIVFACNVEHAINISYALNYRGVSSVSLTSKADKDPGVRKDKIRRFKEGDTKVIVNYGILTTGFDAPRTNVAIIARPTQSLVLYSQMIGRAMRGRRSGGNLKCDIYTVQDDIKQFTNANYAFMNWDRNYIERK